MTDDNIHELAQSLLSKGWVHWKDDADNRVFLAYYGPEKEAPERNEFVLGREGDSVMWFTTERPLNRFRLVEAGFKYVSAEYLAGTVNKLLQATHELVNTQYKLGTDPRNDTSE